MEHVLRAALMPIGDAPGDWRRPEHRYGARPDWPARLASTAATGMVFLLPLLAALVGTWSALPPITRLPARALVVMPLAAPPDTLRDVPEGPPKKEQRAEPAPRPKPQPEDTVVRPAPLPMPAPPRQQPTPPAAQLATQETAPRSIPAPPAPRVASNAEATWEAQLLAHLERHRRYPAAARARNVQGTTYLRFRMDRAGKVLAVAVTRSSGATVLDRAALDTLRRAQPLPPIPDDRPDELDLTIPVEFYVRS